MADRRSETGDSAVGERPWWTKWSKTAAVFVIFALGGAVGGIAVPAWVQLHNGQADRDARARLDRSAAQVSRLNRRVEVSRLLFEHYFGKRAAEQRAALNYLRYEFPHDLRDKSIQAILVIEGKGRVKKVVASSVASAEGVGRTGVDAAEAQERTGFQRLIASDVSGARAAFVAAYTAFPTYHNVDEISHKVLTPAAVGSYAAAEADQRRRILARLLSSILSQYSWGIPAELRPRLEQKLQALR